MNPRLLIVDDETLARRRLATLLTDIAEECPHQLVGEAENAEAALELIHTLRPDILLLDVQMPGMSGMSLAAEIARLPAPPAVVFVTAYDSHALQAFEVQAADYLLKPVRAARLAEAIRRALVHRPVPATGTSEALGASRRYFSVQERGRVLRISVDEVIYCKAELKYVTLHTAERDYLVEESLTAIEEELGAQFVRVHRNALVARWAILGVERGAQQVPSQSESDETERGQESWQVILRGCSERLPISRRQWSVVKALVKSA